MTDSPKKRFHIVVTGKVQGVGFRFFTKETAQKYHISGWVKNCLNGTVESEAQGNQSFLEVFLKELKKGPRFSHVDTVMYSTMSLDENDEIFEIRY